MHTSVSHALADGLLTGFFLSEPQSHDFVGPLLVRNLPGSVLL